MRKNKSRKNIMIRSNSTKNATSYKKYTPYNLLKNKVAVKVAEKIKQMKKATKKPYRRKNMHIETSNKQFSLR